MKTWLLVAAERREFDGLCKRIGKTTALPWPGAKFAGQADWKGERWWMIANGPGSALVNSMLSGEMLLQAKENVSGIMSTGLCGALDPALRMGDIVVMGDGPTTVQPFAAGVVHSSDRVVVTASEKRALRGATGAIAVDMEAAAVREKAELLQLPFYCVRAVSDQADDDLPLDFNRFRNARGDFSRTQIAFAAVAKPFSVLPRLLEFDRNCRHAADRLGEFLAHSRF